MDGVAGLDAGEVNRAFEDVLAGCGDSAIGALGSNGFFVSLPESVPAGRCGVLHGRSAIDLIAPADRLAAARAWGDARNKGVGQAVVHLLDGRAVVCHMFDVRERHGVYLLVMVPEAQDRSAPTIFATAPPISPRVCTMTLEETSVIAGIDDAVTGMLGWADVDLIGQPTLEFIDPDDHVRAIDTWLATLSSPGVAHRMRCRYRRSNGSWLWVEATMVVASGVAAEQMVRCELVDISEEMAAHERLRNRERMLDQLTEALPSGVVQIDPAGRIVHRNDRVHEILGHPGASTLAEQFADATYQDRDALSEAVSTALDGAQGHDLEIHIPATFVEAEAAVAAKVCHVLLRPLTDEAGTTSGAIVSIADVTESCQLRSELQTRATYDALTEVHNRASIMGLLGTALSRPRPAGAGVATLFIDLDRFKDVNDRFGHAAGDHLLTVVAQRLRHAVRDGDSVGRLGGDEFLVVCPGIDAAAARQLTDRVITRLSGPVVLKYGTIDLCASIGTAWSAEPNLAADHLVSHADDAMYEAKRQGKGCPVIVGCPS